MTYPRFSVAERRKLTLSRRATESFRAIGIRGGADPSQGAPTSTPPYYTLSEDDRATFEATMNMTRDNDIKKSATAREALGKAIKDFSPAARGAIDALWRVPVAGGIPLGTVGEAAWMAMRFAGYLTETEWEIPDSEGFCSNEFSAVGVKSVDVQGGTYNVSGGQTLKYERGAAGETITDNVTTVTYQVAYPANSQCRPVICRNGSVVAEIPDCAPSTSLTLNCSPAGGATTLFSPSGATFDITSCRDAENIFAYLYDSLAWTFTHVAAGSPCNPNWTLSGTVAGYTEGDNVTVGFRDPDGSVRCDVLGNGLYDPTPALGDMAPVAATDFPITDIPIDDLCDIIDALQDDPALQDILPDTLPDTPSDIPPIDPNTGLPPGTLPDQPPDPGANPLPGEPVPDVPIQGECFIDAATISTAAVTALTSGQSGAWAARTNDSAERLYAPEGTDGCRDFDPVDEAYLIDALVAEGWATSAQGGGSGRCSVDITTISGAAIDALTSGGTNPWAPDPNDSQERLYAPPGSDGVRQFDPIDERYKIDALAAEGWTFLVNGAGAPPPSWCDGSDGGGLTHICPPADWCTFPVPANAPPGVPIAPGLPPGAIPPVDPIDTGIQDPEDGSCMTLAGKPAGFTDPAQPGGISRKFQPGQPIVIDYGSGSSCKTKITRIKPEQGTEGGPEVCASPTIDNGGKLTDKECYGPGPVVDEINTLLGDMVAEGGNIIFDSECTRELHRPMCFRAGTSKRVILNKLLDMCGFCVFPMFDCNVIVGYCGPVNVHWTYHEDVDLMAFDLEYDGQEVYDYVQVFRGDKMDQAGRILEVGGDVFYPVGSPASSVSGDRVYQHEVPYGTPQTDMLGIAMTLAAKLRTQAMPLVAFGVPLNSQLRTRHQVHFKRPSLGFDAVYMVTKLARDYDRENGHLSTGLARWLRGS